MKLDAIREQIAHQITDDLLTDPTLFLVAVQVSPKLVRVLVDGDAGVSIDQCARLSRQLGKFIEEEDLMAAADAFRLEVSSPGVDEPLRLPRQYPQHEGRTLQVVLPEGDKLTGTLTASDASGFSLLIKTGKGKTAEEHRQTFTYDQVSQVKVKPAF